MSELPTVDDTEELESPEPSSVRDLWWRLIQDEKKKHEGFRAWAEKGQKAYEKECTFNIAWPTIEIQSASLYSSTPDPEVRRRQRDGDKVQKSAAQIIERTLDYCVDQHDFDGNMRRTINDMLNAGLGQARVIYKPEFKTVTPQAIPGMEPPAPIETISRQMLELEHYSWRHFGWQPSKNWEQCEWIYFKHMLSRKQVMTQYNVEASEDYKDEDDETKVAVYEIMHKTSKSVIVIAEQFDVPLSVSDDELGLQGFFPCPEPMMTNVQTDKLIPFTDFKYYAKQFAELDKTSKRLGALTTSTKAQQFYDAHFTELAKLKASQDGHYMPVDDLIDKLNGNKLENILATVPIENNGAIIQMLVDNKQYLKQEVFEILGIADIMRGESNAQEGVETQQLKSEFGAIRIREKQSTVNRFCRDVFRIMGEVIAEHFEPEVLQKATGVQVTPEIMAILRDDMLRNVSIDIETDSTNAGDKMRNQKAANDSLETLIGGMGQILPGMANGIIPKQVGQEMLLMLVRSTPGNTGNIEDIVSQLGDQNSPESMIQQLQQQLQMQGQQMQGMQQELQKRDQATAAKDASVAQLNQAKTQEIAQNLQPDVAHTMSETMLNQVEADGKRVEQAANIVTGAQNREPFIRGVE